MNKENKGLVTIGDDTWRKYENEDIEKPLNVKRISGFCFLLFSGNGMGSFGRRRSFLVVTGFISMESDNRNPEQEKIIHLYIYKESSIILIPNHHAKLLHHSISDTWKIIVSNSVKSKFLIRNVQIEFYSNCSLIRKYQQK